MVSKTLIRRAALTIAGLAILFSIALALPVRSWRTGVIQGPPLPTSPAPPSGSRPLSVWIDTDAACGAGRTTDVDDCLAILLLARDPGVDIVGISTVFGNAPIETTDSITRALVSELRGENRELPEIVRGASEAGSTAPSTAAARALRQAIAAGPLLIAAFGPMTNVAAATSGLPLHQPLDVVAVMGRRRGHLFHPVEGGTAASWFGHGPVFTDFNFRQDPEAATALLSTQINLTLVPYEAATDVLIGSRTLEMLADRGGADRWVAERSQGWLDYWQDEIDKLGFYPFDLLAAAYIVDHDLLRCASVKPWVGRDTGLLGWFGHEGFFVDPPAPAADGSEATTSARYCHETTRELPPWLAEHLPGS